MNNEATTTYLTDTEGNSRVIRQHVPRRMHRMCAALLLITSLLVSASVATSGSPASAREPLPRSELVDLLLHAVTPNRTPARTAPR
jgi:hypothetical protein